VVLVQRGSNRQRSLVRRRKRVSSRSRNLAHSLGPRHKAALDAVRKRSRDRNQADKVV
jgi:hypothetical protein